MVQSDTEATSLFPFIFILVGVLKSNKMTMNLLKRFWSIASPKMLGKCKTGVGINPPQPDEKPKQKGVPQAMTPGVVLGRWKGYPR